MPVIAEVRSDILTLGGSLRHNGTKSRHGGIKEQHRYEALAAKHQIPEVRSDNLGLLRLNDRKSRHRWIMEQRRRDGGPTGALTLDHMSAT